MDLQVAVALVAAPTERPMVHNLGDHSKEVRRRAPDAAGFYGFEWEKKWHPEPEMALPHFARTVAAYLAEAGVRPA